MPRDSVRAGGVFLVILMVFLFIPLREEVRNWGTNASATAGTVAFYTIFDIGYVMLLLFAIGLITWREIQYQSR